MDQSMGPNFSIPPASLELACVVTSLTLIPLYDQYIVPYVRRLPLMITRVTIFSTQGFINF
jgi:hypothetical protein